MSDSTETPREEAYRETPRVRPSDKAFEFLYANDAHGRAMRLFVEFYGPTEKELAAVREELLGVRNMAAYAHALLQQADAKFSASYPPWHSEHYRRVKEVLAEMMREPEKK